MKIAHLADVHIRPVKYLEEMQFTFERLYESLKNESPDLIVIAGDLFHSKLQSSHEYHRIARGFLQTLALLTKEVIVIPGNHDAALSNPDRLDAISPVVESLSVQNVRYLRDTSWYFPEKFPIAFFHPSIFDSKDEWVKLACREDAVSQIGAKIKIALYHGAINGCKTDLGWAIHGNQDDVSLFDNFDFAFLGDIHIAQWMDERGRVQYPGSLRQNNFGETLDKGYLIWEIESAEKFVSRRVILPQKRYFYTITVGDDLRVPEGLAIEKDSRIRIQVSKRVSLVEEEKIKFRVKQLYEPHEPPFVILPDAVGSSLSSQTFASSESLNIRTKESQAAFIKDYLASFSLSDEDVQKILEIDEKYNSVVLDDSQENNVWDLLDISWSNMFSYGTGNKIDFSKIGGITGIFGQNGSGKSSIIDVILYGLFATVWKQGANKNVDYVNKKAKSAAIEMRLSSGKNEFAISRKINKQKTKSGEEKSTTENDFKKITPEKEISLNGESIPETNKQIRNVFGSFEDFAITSLCPQGGLTNFLDAGGTEKKKIFAKFAELEIFDEKNKLASEDFQAIKFANKEYALKNVDQKLVLERQRLDNANEALAVVEPQISAQKEKIRLLDEDLAKLSTIVITDFPKKQKPVILAEIEKTQQEIWTLEHVLSSPSDGGIGKVREIIPGLRALASKTDNLARQSALIKSIPNVEACRSCALASDAYRAEEELLSIQRLQGSAQQIKEKVKLLAERENQFQIRQMNEGKLENARLTLQLLQKDLNLWNSGISELVSMKDAQSEKIRQKKHLDFELRNLENQRLSLLKEIGSSEKAIQIFQEEKDNFASKKDLFRLYEIYLQMMGKNGISYQILGRKLPVVEEETNHILSQIVPFRVQIENNDEEKTIKIFVFADGLRKPVELCSGGEKTLVALALRTVLWRVSGLSKSKILILDESLSFLDEGKHEQVLKLLVYLKNYFKHIILITHNEQLKYIVDSAIYVEKDVEGVSRCN